MSEELEYENSIDDTGLSRLPKSTEKNNLKYVRYIIMLILPIAMIFSVVQSDTFSNPKSYINEFRKFDKKAETTELLIATSTGTGALISLIPNDTGKPVAEKLIDLGEKFCIILGAIYLEKYLITIFSLVGFKYILPSAGFLLFLYLWNPNQKWAAMLFTTALKLALFGIVVINIIPISLRVSDMIEATYQTSIDAATTVNQDMNAQVKNTKNKETAVSDDPIENAKNFFISIPDHVADVGQQITEGTKNLLDQARTCINRLLEAFVIMLIINCVLPILVIVAFIGILKILFGTVITIDNFNSIQRSSFFRNKIKKN